ncbi:hypothetical protein ACTA71_002694 [Dictyostelium dimigraforme]
MLQSIDIIFYNYISSTDKKKINRVENDVAILGIGFSQTGIVLEILRWIVKFSDGWELELLVNSSNGQHIRFHFKSVDISNESLVNQSIDKVLNDNPNIENVDSIFHFGFQQISRKFNVSHGAKTMGAIHLHNQSIKGDWKLKQFVMASSIVSIIGSSKQCSYVCANNVLDSLSLLRFRKSIGLPSISTNYGSLGDSK